MVFVSRDKISKKGMPVLMLVLMLLGFSVISALLYFRNAYPFGGDLSFYYNGIGNVYSSFFLWSQNNYSGLIGQSANSPIGLILAVVFYLPFLGFGVNAIKYSLITEMLFLRVIGSIGMFFFIYKISPMKDDFSKALGSFFASLIFVSVFSDFGATYSGILILPSALLVFYFFQKSIASGKNNLMLFSFSVVAVASLLYFVGSTLIIQVSLLLLLFFLVPLLSSYRKTVLKQATFGLLVLILSYAIVLPQIVTVLISNRVLSNQLLLVEGNSAFDFSNYASNIFLSFESAFPFSFLTYPDLLYFVSFFVALLSISLVTIMFLKNQKKDKKIEIGAISALALSLLLFFGLSGTIHKPFGVLFSYLYRISPDFLAFRYGSASNQIIFFIIAALFGFGLSYLFSITRDNNRYLFYFCVALTALFCVLFLYFNTFLPIATNGVPWTNHLLPFITNFPSYVINIASYINQNVSGYAVATLPSDDDWHLSKWYDAPDIYSSIIRAPVYTGGFTAYNEYFFPPSQGQYSYLTVNAVQNTRSQGFNISAALSTFGIRYIVVQGDTANTSFGPNHLLLPYNLSDIYRNLNASNGIEFVKRFGNSSVYVNRDAAPLVYSSDILTENGLGSEQVINLIGYENINISKYSVYSQNVLGSILWYGTESLFNASNTVQIYTIKNFSPPAIKFVQKTPTKIDVFVSGATTPYYLVFRETYDPNWVLYLNGAPLPPSSHILVNGFANAWYVDKPGNYTLTLYYKPQTYLWYSWIISFAALLFSLVVGVFGYLHRNARF